MDKLIFVEQVCSYLHKRKFDLVKKKHGKVPNITLAEFLEAVYEFETIPNIAASFGVSIQTINRILRINFPDVKLLGYRTWKYYFLDLLNYRSCNQCSLIKNKESFYNLTTRGLVGKDSICKECSNANRKQHVTNRPDLHKASTARTRARKKQAIPKWADMDKIRQIYINCPKDYQVDHIIPLQGKEVCGLHVENNLQYLTKSDNCRKSNKLVEKYL